MKRLISCLLCIAILATMIPATVLADAASQHEPYSIDNGYIHVDVSKKNGGFMINTEQGDVLKKSDNNKKLLFHDGEYDTSFVSFRVEFSDGKIEDYIFGGKYGNISDPSRNGVTVKQETQNGEIVASWSVGQLTFIQNISLANEASNEHGMVSIQLSVENASGSPVSVKARILFDSCLGDKDFVYYQAVKDGLAIQSITTEQVLDGKDYPIPQNFYAMDDPLNPSITAYSVNSPSGMPYLIAFGHWNNLASTLFDFVPDPGMDFTNIYNEYLTADSAYALYYDLGTVANSLSIGQTCYYGVYSRHNVPASDSVAVDVSVPMRLELNSAKTGYIRLSDVGQADFAMGVVLENYLSNTSMDLKNIALSIRSTSNLRILSDNGSVIRQFGEIDPLTVNYSDFKVGQTLSKTLYFEAKINENAAYERITISVYDVAATGGAIADDHKIGEKIVYVLLPGSDGAIPKVNFISMTPDIIYCSGIRHLFAAITNPSMLDNRANWELFAYTIDGKTRVSIPHNGIRITDGVMDVSLDDEIKLAPGSWYLQLEWTDDAVSNGIATITFQKQTATVLNFVVSEDIKYKNDSYGVLCVVEYNKDYNVGKTTEEYTHDSLYRLEAFEDEAAFKKFSADKSKYVEILLVFRGEFTGERKVKAKNGHEETTYYTAVSSKKLDLQTREYVVDNCITINGCMDFEDGTLAVYYESYNNPEGFWKASVMVEFDGQLLTSDARTSVWKGKAIFTKIEQGSRYSLRPYDKNGNRQDNFGDQTILLIWPSVYGLGQTLAGMIFKLAYGELGVIKDDDGKEIGRVLSFSASFSKSFLNPKEGDKPRDTYWTKMQELFEYHTTDTSVYKAVYGNDKINAVGDFTTVNESNEDEVGFSASVMVQDILFGCGVGFYGMHFKVELGIQNYIENLPKIKGVLEVNTINDWAFKFEGGMKLATFTAEAKLSFKSRNNVPVPDDLYFYMGGFKPGINIDTFGVVWITGGGGGISNLYDTIFLSQALPPLKLIMSVGLSLIQILDAKATLGIGLTGISLSAKDIKIYGVIEAIRQISLGLEWYPGIDLKASMKLKLFEGIIVGNGYIVLIGKEYKDWFFEMYAKAALRIPKSVPLVGGMNLLSVDLGLNTEKIWGGFEVLSIGYGITYYWGEPEVNFTTGGIKATPTFPDLLGQDDIPVYYDQERDQTLYARFGTNISGPEQADVIDLSTYPTLMAAGLGTYPGGKLHKFNLGEYNASTKAAIVQISYPAISEADAISKANSFKIKDTMNAGILSGYDFSITLFDPAHAADAPENAGANANITFNDTTGMAAFCFTVTSPFDYDMDWFISTGNVESTVLLYHVNPLPKVDTVSGTLDGSKIDMSWDGSSLDELDKISFYLTDDNDPENTDVGIPLAVIDDSLVIDSKSKTIDVPANVPSGEYYIRAVYSKEGEINGVVFSGNKINYVNSNTPGPCSVTSFVPAGNLEYKLTIPTDVNTAGYLVSIYNEDGTPTDLIDMPYEKAESGPTVITIGGSYEYSGEPTIPLGQSEDPEERSGNKMGLTGDKSYYAIVVPYNLVDSDNDGEMDTSVYGTQAKTATVLLPVQTTPNITITSDKPKTVVKRVEFRKDDNDPDAPAVETEIYYITYTDNTITFTASSDQIVEGQWSLDDALIKETAIPQASENPMQPVEKPTGTFINTKSITIPLSNLTEGSHTLEITGNNNQGDRFRYSYIFDVDIVAPRLMLTSPVNGSFFGKDGKLTVSGVTDADAHFTITSDQETICNKYTVAQLGGTIDSEGVFQFTIDIPDPNNASVRELTISVSDAAGNTVTKNVGISHGGLGDIERLQVLVDDSIMANGNIPAPVLGQQSNQLTLLGVTSDNRQFRLFDNGNISWLCHTVEGNASVDQNGILTMGADAQGIIVGQLEVTQGAYRTVALTFGADTNAIGATVAVTSTIGGTVTGAGIYPAGANVTLTASADSGYTFKEWTIAGATVSDKTKTTITFIMPDSGNVTAHAVFAPVSSETKPASPHIDPPFTFKVIERAGELVQTRLPQNANPNTYVPYYMDEAGNKVYVAISYVQYGVLYFVAPVKGTYYFVENSIDFNDIKDHWAEAYISYMYARGLFIGVGDDMFAPDTTMTRAMFVTVLHRLAGEPEPKNPATFQDVPAGSWYEKAVAWANENGIVNGIDQNAFAPNVLLKREEMCALIARYARFIEIDFGAQGQNTPFIDADTISAWAADDVAFCQSIGLIIGFPDNSFEPKAGSSRAEGCTVFMRFIELLLKHIASGK